MVRGVLTQKGLASSVSEMWNSSPSMFLIRPSKTVGNSIIKDSDVEGLAASTGVAKPLIVAVWGLVSGIGEFKGLG